MLTTGDCCTGVYDSLTPAIPIGRLRRRPVHPHIIRVLYGSASERLQLVSQHRVLTNLQLEVCPGNQL